jgi:hypothetical protein
MTRLSFVIQEMNNKHKCITPVKNTQRSKLLVQILHESRSRNEASCCMNLELEPRT